MIDARFPNYTKTLVQLEKLRLLIEKLDRNIDDQIPQGLTKEFFLSKDDF